MKIVAVMGTPRKNGAGAEYVKRLEQAAKTLPGVEFEYLWLGDFDLKLCRGCMACYERGEAACPLKDGYLAAMQKLNAADAAVFYSPTYTLSITGLVKTFFDRSSYVFHRPYFKGRRAVVLTAVEAYGDKTALSTLRLLTSMMGFAVAGAAGVVNMKYRANAAYRERANRRLDSLGRKLARLAASGKRVRPSFIELLAFQYQKAAFGAEAEHVNNDMRFWREAGWTKPGALFYCEARVSRLRAGLAQTAAGMAKRLGLLA